MTAREKNIEIVRAACVKANPQPQEDFKCGGCRECEACLHYDEYERTICLADVLLAIKEVPNKNWRIEFDRLLQESLFPWNLLRDELTLQSDECVAFCAGLLTN